MIGATDYIRRVRARSETAARQPHGEAAGRTAINRFVVLVTRDGSTIEELPFERPPTLGDLLTRVGADAYVLGISAASTAARIAAE
ncbi:MAG: hypothetical protein ACK4NE_06830 [Albidovulum sp.]